MTSVSDQVSIKMDPQLRDMLAEEAKEKYSNPTAVARKCLLLTLPLLRAGIPESALEAMAGKRGRR